MCELHDNDCDGLIDDADTNVTYQAEDIWYTDGDGDGYGDAHLNACDQPQGYVDNSDDCDDADVFFNPNTVWYVDADADGFGDSSSTTNQCTQPAGYVLDDTDCNDADERTYPNAPELCNDGVDQSCDGVLDAATCAQVIGDGTELATVSGETSSWMGKEVVYAGTVSGGNTVAISASNSGASTGAVHLRCGSAQLCVGCSRCRCDDHNSSLTGNEKLGTTLAGRSTILVQRTDWRRCWRFGHGLSLQQWNGLGSGWTVGWRYRSCQ